MTIDFTIWDDAALVSFIVEYWHSDKEHLRTWAEEASREYEKRHPCEFDRRSVDVALEDAEASQQN